MRKSSLATLLLAFAVLGCKSGKIFHLAADNPYVDPKSGAVREYPLHDRMSWWNILFSKDEPESERVKFKDRKSVV